MKTRRPPAPALPRPPLTGDAALTALRRNDDVIFAIAPATLATKRILDLVGCLALAVIGLPVALLAMALVKLTSPGPALYRQRRVGRNGQAFTIFKIRTMVDHCESLTGPRWCVPGDPRITPIGQTLRKLHIDELPQLINVVRGEMSLIGPRPERPEFVAQLMMEVPHYDRRHAILPGITGLAQVQMPSDTEVLHVERKIRFDLYYLAHLSLWLDVKILFCTALKVVGVPITALCQLMGVIEDPWFGRYETTATTATLPNNRRAA